MYIMYLFLNHIVEFLKDTYNKCNFDCFQWIKRISLINTFQRTASKAYLFISINFWFRQNLNFSRSREYWSNEIDYVEFAISCVKSNTTIEQALHISRLLFQWQYYIEICLIINTYSFQMWITHINKNIFIYI